MENVRKISNWINILMCENHDFRDKDGNRYYLFTLDRMKPHSSLWFMHNVRSMIYPIENVLTDDR